MTKGYGNKFGRKKEAAIAALLVEKNHADAARVVGIDLTTLKRWLRLPEFKKEWRRARWEVVDQAYARAQQYSGSAIAVLLKLMADPATAASSRIRAASGTLGVAREALDLDVETHLAELEEAAASRQPPTMKIIDRRLRKLEDRFGPADGKPSILLVVCNAGWGLALDQDRCIEILLERGFVSTAPVGLVNLLDIPEGLNAEETERFLQGNGAKRFRFQTREDDQQKCPSFRYEPTHDSIVGCSYVEDSVVFALLLCGSGSPAGNRSRRPSIR